MKTIQVQVNGETIEVTKETVTLNLVRAQERLDALNAERNRLVKSIHRYKNDLKKFDEL